ncbi:galanin receptor 2a-like [Polyodon spathula]|uniref:galanin receptor 2a-like n=1 Tax=Polyodon spathula TaxID=7913 RepID=UPI001B7DF577|nr:galanin receptor 2a-like [Polyodon spathula]
MCKAVHFFIYLTMHASSFTLAAVSVDRYLAIRHPLKSRDLRTSRNATAAIALIWTLSLLFSAPYLAYFHTVRLRGGGGASPGSSPSLAGGGVSVVCVPVWTDRSRKIMDLITFSFGYLLPVCTLGLAYTRTLLFLWGPGDPLDRPPGAQPGRGARGRVTRMIVAVAVLFCVCWLPHHLLILWFWFGGHFPFNRVTYALRLASHCLSYANSCLNPLVYALVSKHFRKGLKQIFSCLLLQERSGRERPPAARQPAAPTALRGLADPPSPTPPPPSSSSSVYKLLPFRRHGNRVAPLPGRDGPPAAKPIASELGGEGAGPSRRGEEPGTGGGGAEQDRRREAVPGSWKRCDWTAGGRREGPGKAWEV